jgi:hemolysin-activating ACP:hemolysin acyltransferase
MARKKKTTAEAAETGTGELAGMPMSLGASATIPMGMPAEPPPPAAVGAGIPAEPRVPLAGAPGSGAPLAPTREEEEGRQRTKATAAIFGEVIGALMRSPRHRRMRLEELENVVVPAIATGQFAVAHQAVEGKPGETMPIAAIFWARVSPQVDERLQRANKFPAELSRHEWASGEIPWLVDAVGQQQIVERLIAELTVRGLGGVMPRMPGWKAAAGRA